MSLHATYHHASGPFPHAWHGRWPRMGYHDYACARTGRRHRVFGVDWFLGGRWWGFELPLSGGRCGCR